MSEKIEPALTREQWDQEPNEYGQTFWNFGDVHVSHFDVDGGDIAVNYDGAVYDSGRQLLGAARHAVIALINDSLPDDDPRKITREKIEGLRTELSSENNFADKSDGWAFLDALESYLAPI